MPTDIVEVKLRRWSEGRVVVLGDAAHSFGPYIGFGGSMALEDAYVLAAELMKISSEYPMATAFRAYERERKRRIAIATAISHRIRNGTLIKSRVVRALANVFLPLIPDSYILRDLNRLLAEEI
jgi:2-polyprenyl-6-methoxyphenol hydroxylase-like FAD-dependent oxidoreductase